MSEKYKTTGRGHRMINLVLQSEFADDNADRAASVAAAASVKSPPHLEDSLITPDDLGFNVESTSPMSETPSLLLSPTTTADIMPILFSSDDEEELLMISTRAIVHSNLEEESGCGFVSRSGDAGGGQFVVRAKHAAEQIALAVLEHTVTERLGSKAARIFRLIRDKKYVEEDTIQKCAMLLNKECKELTYKLLEQHFISVQPMRKAASSGGMAKAIYLYHIKLHDAAHTGREMCYRALHNVLSRAATVRRTHARLLHKQRRVRSIVHGMRARAEPDQHIDDVEETLTPPERASLAAIERQLKQLSAAELALDRDLFALHWYFIYS